MVSAVPMDDVFATVVVVGAMVGTIVGATVGFGLVGAMVGAGSALVGAWVGLMTTGVGEGLAGAQAAAIKLSTASEMSSVYFEKLCFVFIADCLLY